MRPRQKEQSRSDLSQSHWMCVAELLLRPASPRLNLQPHQWEWQYCHHLCAPTLSAAGALPVIPLRLFRELQGNYVKEIIAGEPGWNREVKNNLKSWGMTSVSWGGVIRSHKISIPSEMFPHCLGCNFSCSFLFVPVFFTKSLAQKPLLAVCVQVLAELELAENSYHRI